MGKIDIFIVIAYLIGMLIVGGLASKKQKNMETFFLGNKDLGIFSMMSLWLSAWVGGAAIVGTAGNAYSMGVSAVWYSGAVCIGFAIFGIGFAGIIKDAGDRFNHITYPDLIEDRYDSKTRVIAIISTILANVAYNAGQLVAAGGVMSAFLGWDLSLSIVVSAVVVTIYTASGGLLAVTYTDILQTLLIIFSLFAAIPFVREAALEVNSIHSLPSEYFSLTSWGPVKILGLVVSIVLTFFTSMDSYTRSFAARDRDTAKKGTLYAIIGTFLIATTVTYLGMSGKIIFKDLSDPDTILPMLIIEILPNGLKGVMLVGLMSALMSTSDISTLSASANITRDIYNRYINREASEEKLYRVSILSSVFVGILSTFLALKMMNIVDILYIAFTINSAGLFLPTISMFFWERANSKAAFYSMGLTLVVIIIWFLASEIGIGGIFRVDPLWPGLLTSILTFIPLTLYLEPSEEDIIKSKKYLIK